MSVATDPRVGAEHTFEHGGRRWRCTDPAIPDALRTELVDELMAARRAIAAANRAGDDAARAAARERVQDAKVALGERGTPWWEQPDREAAAGRLEAAILALLRQRDGRTTCPSDAARISGGVHWRELMPLAREVAFELQGHGLVEVRARGARVASADEVHGPIRIARGAGLVGRR